MIYIDESLCTGCGVCLATCSRGALLLSDGVAVINQSLCTLCGRCLETCAAGAIISMEVAPPSPSTALDQRAKHESLWTRPPFYRRMRLTPQPPAASTASESATISKLVAAEKVLSVFVSLANFALDRKQGRSTCFMALNTRAGSAMGLTSGGCGSRRRRRRVYNARKRSV